ncbi:unnamed protein product [Calypogeia fissa]
MMGRGGGAASSQWRRWHELGGRILVLVRNEQRISGGQDRSFGSPLFRDGSVLLSTSTSTSTCKAKAKATTSSVWIASDFPISSRISSSKCGNMALSNVQQHRRNFASASVCPSRNVNACSPRKNSGVLNKSMDLDCLGSAQHWSHSFSSKFSGVLVVRNYCCHSRGISTAAISAGSPGCGAEQPSSTPEIDDQEPVFPIFPSHNSLPAFKPVRRGVAGVSIANAILDPGIDVPYMSRASKLPLHSALPSLRAHRLGDPNLAFLQGFEATAPLPAGEAVDWQQQRLGRVRDQEARYRQPPPPPRSDAEPDDIFIPVKAFYISRSVDLKSLAREPFLEVTSSRNNLIIRCADRPPHSPVTADNPEMACLGFLKERYMVAFQYGSVVFFNFGDLEEVESLDIVRKYCSDEFREARKDGKHLDDYGVLVRPTLSEWSEGGHDRVMLRKLDIDNIRVISSILGQSIALDHYAKKVDEMVTTFSELNRGMEQTGTFTMTRKSLFQLVAAANTTLADVILRLGLLERSDAAWKDANYAQIWEYLRDDFELDERFESLDFKLNIIQHNVRFFLEILQNRKSDTLEWIIILLITGEICVSLYDILHTAGAI